jgi:tetratricopeptide (TPR) repeat protein
MQQYIADLSALQEMREAGDYEKLAAFLGADWRDGPPFDQEAIERRLLAAELAGRAGRLHEMEAALRPYLESTDGLPLGLAARVLSMISLYHYRRNDAARSLRLASQSRAVASARDDEWAMAETLHMEGQALWLLERNEEAIESFKEAIAMYAIQGRPYRLGLAHLSLGAALNRVGRVEEARITLERSIKTLLRCKDEYNLAAARLNVATPLNAIGEHETALKYLTFACEKFEQMGHEQYVYLALNQIAATHIFLKEYDRAEIAVIAAMEKGMAMRSALLPATYEIKGRLHIARREWEIAELSLRAAQEIADQIGDHLNRAIARRTLGRLYLAREMDEPAATVLWQAMDAAQRTDDELLRLELKTLLAQALCKTDPVEACRFLSDVDAELGTRPLPELRRDAQVARRRIDSLDQEHFFVLSDLHIPSLSEAKTGLLKWLWARALHKARGNAREAAKILGVTPTYIRKLTKVIPRDLLRTRKRASEKAARAQR